MSEYFRVLKRIELEQPVDITLRRPRRVPSPEPVALPVIQTTPQATIEPTLVSDPSPAAAAAFALLHDTLRGLAAAGPIRSLVFAGVSAAESVRTITTGLAAHLDRIGLTAVIGELGTVRARPVLRLWRKQPTSRSAVGDAFPLDLHGHAAPPEVREWLGAVTGDAAMVLIEAPPLAEAIDAALLARACDGLVLVVETLATSRDALQLAANRARLAGCRTLGVVTYGSHDRMPAWIRRWVERDPQRLLTTVDA